jgi:uncharacterized membrane protein required for colicin V production
MWYDILTLAILGYTTIRGAAKGFVWQVAAIAALVLCFAFAGPLSLVVAPVITLQPPLNRWVAMLIIYLGFSFLSFATARNLRTWIEKARFVEFDRHLGTVFGFIKGFTICLVLTFFIVTLSERARETILHSRSGYIAAVVMDRLHPVMPRELHDVLEPYIHKLDRPDIDLRHGPGGHGHVHNGDGHNGGQGGTRDPLDDHDPFPADRPGSTQTELERIVSKIPGHIDESLRRLVLEAVRNTAPEHRPALISQLSSGIPGLIRSVALEWKDGKPASDDSGSQQGGDSRLRQQQRALLREIVAVYSDFPDAQATIIDEVEASLAGLPDEIAYAVIEDWYADLLTFGPDPDPSTSFTTPLDLRILSQLNRARIPMASLKDSLRNRLSESLR